MNLYLFGPRYARVPGFPAFELAFRSPFGWGQLAVASLMLDWRTVGSSITASSTAFNRFTSSRGRRRSSDQPVIIRVVADPDPCEHHLPLQCERAEIAADAH